MLAHVKALSPVASAATRFKRQICQIAACTSHCERSHWRGMPLCDQSGTQGLKIAGTIWRNCNGCLADRKPDPLSAIAVLPRQGCKFQASGSRLVTRWHSSPMTSSTVAARSCDSETSLAPNIAATEPPRGGELACTWSYDVQKNIQAQQELHCSINPSKQGNCSPTPARL